MSGKHEASTQIETQLRENLITLARKVPGPGKLQLSRRSAPQLLAARPGPCKTKNPYDAQKSKNFSEKKRKVGPNLGPKSGTRNWSPGALAIKFLKEGQILDQFLVPVSGSKNRSRKSKKNRKISKNWIQFGTPMWGRETYF